jgi:multidrug efflux pump subunit AcrA (membrane-fusion protein)
MMKRTGLDACFSGIGALGRNSFIAVQAGLRAPGRLMSRPYGGVGLACMFGMAGLSGCGASATGPQAAIEVVAARDWLETLTLDGEIKASANTPLSVPGSGWDRRTLVFMVDEASAVQKGQVLARFDAPNDRMELSQAETELMRKVLGEAGITNAVRVNRAELAADSTTVQTSLTLSQRYAEVDQAIYSHSKLLDTLQDIGFLNAKQQYLGWKNGQLDARSGADRAVLASQKDSVQLTASEKRKSLAALEIIAPHDGVFLLETRWDGSKPQIGGALRSGEQFGKLPDSAQLLAHFSLPEGQAFGLKPGLPLRVRLAGNGSEIDLSITRVGSSASVKSGESPVKYSDFDCAIPPAVATRLGLKPGQALGGTVRLVERKNAVTVPNVALVQDGNALAVWLQDGSGKHKQVVQTGMRGPVRSEIKSGLALGAQVLLLPETTTGKP